MATTAVHRKYAAPDIAMFFAVNGRTSYYLAKSAAVSAPSGLMSRLLLLVTWPLLPPVKAAGLCRRCGYFKLMQADLKRPLYRSRGSRDPQGARPGPLGGQAIGREVCHDYGHVGIALRKSRLELLGGQKLMLVRAGFIGDGGEKRSAAAAFRSLSGSVTVIGFSVPSEVSGPIS